MWKSINEGDIKSVPVGTKVRINGTETTITAKSETECGFDTAEDIYYGYPWKCHSVIFSSEDWHRGYTVEVWEEPEVLPEFKSMKFRVRDEDHSRQIQETLFGLGYSWYENCEHRCSVKYTDCKFLYTYDNGDLAWSNIQPFFDGSESQENIIEPVGGFNVVPVTPENPAKKMTQEEIEEILGHPVEIVPKV